MTWFARRRPRERTIVLRAPSLDGSTWPPADPGARHGFAAATVLRLGLDAAFTPEAHDITDLITTRLLPLLELDASPTDLPHVIDLLRSAVQTGAGIGLVDRRNTTLTPLQMSADAAGALGDADRDLPPMPPILRGYARYLLHAGHHVARQGPSCVSHLEASLAGSSRTD